MPRRSGSNAILLNYDRGVGMLICFYRYLSQVRQELALRLLARVYAGGPTPSKVIQSHDLLVFDRAFADILLVVAEFHEAEIHGQVILKDLIFQIIQCMIMNKLK